MTRLYTTPSTKKSAFYYIAKSNETKPEIKVRIAQEISEYCTKPLFVSVRQMTKHISYIITTDTSSKGLK